MLFLEIEGRRSDVDQSEFASGNNLILKSEVTHVRLELDSYKKRVHLGMKEGSVISIWINNDEDMDSFLSQISDWIPVKSYDEKFLINPRNIISISPLIKSRFASSNYKPEIEIQISGKYGEYDHRLYNTNVPFDYVKGLLKRERVVFKVEMTKEEVLLLIKNYLSKV